MLDVIGAGATATTDRDWHDIWKNTPEAKSVEDSIQQIYADGKNKPPVEVTLRSEYATGWMNQFVQLLRRDMMFRWRNPTYLIAKLTLNICGGLFIGFTFFKAKNSQQGTQNKLFVSDTLCSLFFSRFDCRYSSGDLHGHHCFRPYRQSTSNSVPQHAEGI